MHPERLRFPSEPTNAEILPKKVQGHYIVTSDREAFVLDVHVVQHDWICLGCHMVKLNAASLLSGFLEFAQEQTLEVGTLAGTVPM